MIERVSKIHNYLENPRFWASIMIEAKKVDDRPNSAFYLVSWNKFIWKNEKWKCLKKEYVSAIFQLRKRRKSINIISCIYCDWFGKKSDFSILGIFQIVLKIYSIQMNCYVFIALKWSKINYFINEIIYFFNLQIEKTKIKMKFHKSKFVTLTLIIF